MGGGSFVQRSRGKNIDDDDASSAGGAYIYDGDSVSGMSVVSGFDGESREGSIK